jgi:hypothetical protein
MVRRRAALAAAALLGLLGFLLLHPGWRMPAPVSGPVRSLLHATSRSVSVAPECDPDTGCCVSREACETRCLEDEQEGEDKEEKKERCEWICLTWSGSITRFPNGRTQRFLNDTHRHCFRGPLANAWPPSAGRIYPPVPELILKAGAMRLEQPQPLHLPPPPLPPPDPANNNETVDESSIAAFGPGSREQLAKRRREAGSRESKPTP